MRLPIGLTLLLLALVQILSAQKHGSGYPQPPAPADTSNTLALPSTSTNPSPRIDALQLQREARELLELSQSLQPDIESVNHGMLPKDTIDKLKRIEKLAKHLRGEITP
jgi:hypothetical protein